MKKTIFSVLFLLSVIICFGQNAEFINIKYTGISPPRFHTVLFLTKDVIYYDVDDTFKIRTTCTNKDYDLMTKFISNYDYGTQTGYGTFKVTIGHVCKDQIIKKETFFLSSETQSKFFFEDLYKYLITKNSDPKIIDKINYYIKRFSDH